VRGPRNFVYRFRWNLFFEYLDGGHQVQKKADVHPLAVAGRDSHLEFIEFDITGLPEGQRPNWTEGRYSLELEGWVNRSDRRGAPNLRATYHFTVSDVVARNLANDEDRGMSTFLTCPVEEWATPA